MVLLPFLNIGLTSANLKSSGNSPSESVLSNKFFKGFAKDLAECFKSFGWKLSGPGDLFTLSSKSAFSNSLIETVQFKRGFGISFS